MSQINVGAAIVAVAFDFEYTSYAVAHETAAVRTLVGSRLQLQHAQLVSEANQFLKVTKQVLHRDDKQFKYSSN